MCFKKWFGKPDPVIPFEPKKMRASFWAINNYPSLENDLAGCINDMEDRAVKAHGLHPDFEVRTYPDSCVTKNRMITEVGNAIDVLRPGDLLWWSYSGHGTQIIDPHGDDPDGYDEALYLYDGPLSDDEIHKLLVRIPEGAIVICDFDSCFSGTVTRAMYDGNPKKNRFMQTPGVPIKRGMINKIARGGEDSNWITFSACGECQTSADAYFNNRPNGAFSYYFLRALTPGITYREWYERTRQYLPSHDFSQIPELEGKEELLNKIIFT
jgi:hypothetical protein